MKYKIIAKNDEGEGLLSMKQGEKQEAKKSPEQKNIELCNFIKNAFVVDGDVKLVYDEKFANKTYFICEDSKRGKFWVAYGFLK